MPKRGLDAVAHVRGPTPQGRLQQSQLMDALGEFVQGIRVDYLSRLPGVVVYQLQVNFVLSFSSGTHSCC